MSNSILPPARRSTRAQLAIVEQHQTAVIAWLRAAGEDHLADRLERCQQARRTRQPGQWPWRCGLAGCWACRRTTARKWWRGFLQWLTGPETSLVTIPVTATSDVLTTIRRMRKGLRDVRDRAARIDPAWAGVALAGMLNGNHLLIVVQHVGIARDTLWTMLEPRWPEAIVTTPTSTKLVQAVKPRSECSVEQTVQLAAQRRGVEPIRIVIPAQVRAGEPDEFDDAMPLTF